MSTILDIVENWDEIPKRVLDAVGTDRLQNEVQRALNVGAEPPLTYVGAGATATVFCDSQLVAYKVAHYENDHSRDLFLREYEWLDDAFELGLPVAEPMQLELYDLVLIRACPVGPPGTPYHGKELQRLHFDVMRPAMEKAGWTMPEFKEDSFVIDEEDGPTLVDASAPLRIGAGMVRFAKKVLSGKRDLFDENYQDVAKDLETEVLMERVDRKVVEPLVRKLIQMQDA